MEFNTTESINSLFCSFNNHHLLADPKTLPCNRSLCSACLKNFTSYNGKIKCYFCSSEHDSRVDNIEYKNDLNSEIEENLQAICDCFCKTLKQKLKICVDQQSNFQEAFENYVNFIEDEIEIRIESIKISIDEVKEKLLKRIDSLNENHKLNLKNLSGYVDGIVKRGFDEKSIKTINKLNKELTSFENKFADYSIEDCFLEKSEFIGLLKGPYINVDKLMTSKPVILDFSEQVRSLCGLCVLNDNRLAVSDFKRNEIDIFDRNFIGLERINHVQGARIRNYYGISASDDDGGENVYLCDLEYSRILITNNDFSLIKRIILKGGVDIAEFECARDICYHAGMIFTLDQGNKFVFIFNKNGDFIRNFNLNDESKANQFIKNPVCIAACDDVIAVIDWKKSIFIYNFNGYLVNVINQPNVTTLCIKYDYLLTHGENGVIGCYSRVETHKFIKVREEYFENLKYRSETMVIFNDKLVISMGWAKVLAVTFIC